MSIPLAAKNANITIFDSTPSTGAQTPLTANWKAGTILSTGNARSCALTVKYDADASGTANRAQMIVAVSNAETEPAIGDDVWVPLTERDLTPTDGVVTGTFPTGWDATATPEWGVVKLRGLVFELYPADNATDKWRLGPVVDVSHWRWIVVMAKELGDQDAGDVGLLVVDAAMSA